MHSFLVASVMVAPSLASPSQVDSGAVTAEFLGASGQFRLWVDGKEGQGFKVKQNKLVEVTPAGKQVQNMNVAGRNSWDPLVQIEDGKVWMTHFQALGNVGQEFDFYAYLSKDSTETRDDLHACDNCVGQSQGQCQNPKNMACTPSTGPGNDFCPIPFEPCSSPVTIEANTLKFSLRVRNWQFADPANLLTYSIAISGLNASNVFLGQEGGGARRLFASDSDGDSVEADLGNNNKVYLPLVAEIHGNAEGHVARQVEVDVNLNEKGTPGGGSDDTLTVSFVFPSFQVDEELYYDPTFVTSWTSFELTSAEIVAITAGSMFLVGASLFCFYRVFKKKGALVKDQEEGMTEALLAPKDP